MSLKALLEETQKNTGCAKVEGPGRNGDSCYAYDTEDKCPRCLLLWHLHEAHRIMALPRTRLWQSDSGSSTCVQFRTDADPMVFLHTNLGWVPIGNTPEGDEEAEAFAVSMAEGYGLVESSWDTAVVFLGE